MDKVIYFDMDGTLADLYNVPQWLDKLIAEDATPYRVAKPMLNLSRLARLLNRLQRAGFSLGIIYLNKVIEAKCEWLSKHLPSVKWDEIHIVNYGTDKSSVCHAQNGILFDDEQCNLEAWNEYGFYPDQIFSVLTSLLDMAA